MGFVQRLDRLTLTEPDRAVARDTNKFIEVEQALARHPAVLECAVVAIPHDTWGERPKAFVTLKPEARASEAEIIERRTLAATALMPRSGRDPFHGRRAPTASSANWQRGSRRGGAR